MAVAPTLTKMPSGTQVNEVATNELSSGSESRSLLESVAIRATAWTIVSYAVTVGLRFGNNLILSHLVAPEAFGLLALVSTVIMGINLVSDLGLSEALVQNERGDEPLLLSTIWTLQVIRGIGVWVVLLVLAWPAAAFYRDAHLLTLIPVAGLSSALGGFFSVNLLSLQRHLGVRRLFFIDLSTQLVQLAVTVVWAKQSPTVWALAGGTVVCNGYRLAISHVRWIVPGIQTRFALDVPSVRSLVRFGRWIIVGTASFFLASQADRLILGKLISFRMLGVYGIAFAISDIPRQVILFFCGRVGFPFIAKFAGLPRAAFRASFLRYRFYVLVVGALALTVVVYAGGPLILRVYDRRYSEAAWMVPILALGLWHTLLYSTIKPGLYSVGKTSYHAAGNIAYLVAMLVGLPLGFHLAGMFGVVVAVAAGDLPLYIINVWGASREQIGCWRSDFSATAIFVALLTIGLWIVRSIH